MPVTSAALEASVGSAALAALAAPADSPVGALAAVGSVAQVEVASPACSAAQAPPRLAARAPPVVAASASAPDRVAALVVSARSAAASLSAPLCSYIRAHGGGTLAISSQTTAETAIIDSDAHVAGIGGFSGNESEVTAAWLAQEIRAGKIRWVLDDESGFGGGFGGISDGRVGSRDAMQWVGEACRRATTTGGSVLYDCSGRASRILQVAGKS